MRCIPAAQSQSKRIIDEKLRTIEDSIDATKQYIVDLESVEESEPQTSQRKPGLATWDSLSEAIYFLVF